MQAGSDDQVSSPQHKRARLDVSNGTVSDQPLSAGSSLEHSFIQDTVNSESEDDEDDAITNPSDQKRGKRKVKIEYIQDKSERHMAFSKRKAGTLHTLFVLAYPESVEIMKKAYELSTLTGTQVLLLVVSETDVYSFTTAKLEPLVTQPEGQNLIQTCLNTPHSSAAKEAVAVDLVNRLPVEILSEVFLLACAHRLDKSELDEMNRWRIPLHHHRLMFARNAVPYNVSSVCKRWRSIGLSTPKLWSKFTIPGPDFRYLDSERGKSDRTKFIVALRTWLKRSKDHPLQFTCLAGFYTGDEVFMELLKNLPRWHIAYFWHPHASSLAQEQEWFGNDGLKAKNLDTLEFDGCGDGYGEFMDISFQRFPNLRRLRIHPNCLAVEEARGLSLTHLILTELEGDIATFFSHLSQFPSLISFEAPVDKLENEDDSGHLPLTVFTHTTLTALTITEYHRWTNVLLSDILTNIHLPSIHCLFLKYDTVDYFQDTLSQRVEMADAVNDFIRRHESTFTDFELSGLTTSSDEMIETLRMFPKHLTSYQSIVSDFTDECVKRLTLDPLDPSQDLASDLSSISLSTGNFTAHHPASGLLLAEMILSRWARNPHTTFKLHTDYTGLNPLSDPRIARRMQYNPGLLVFTGRQR